MMINVFKLYQVSPANSFPGLVDRFDLPIGRTAAQGLDLMIPSLPNHRTQAKQIINLRT